MVAPKPSVGDFGWGDVLNSYLQEQENLQAAHIAAASGVHGLTGSVVGTSDTQTLTAKTLTSPNITAPVITGAASIGSGATLTAPTITAPTISGSMANIGGAGTAYTPAWTASTTNPVINNGTLIGRWRQIGKFVTFIAVVIGGTTTTVGSGTYSLSLPVASLTSSEQVVASDFFDGAAHYSAIGLIASGALAVNPFSTKGGTAGSMIGVGSTSFSAGTAAIIVCQGTYEAA